jgi:hypothetical protein
MALAWAVPVALGQSGGIDDCLRDSPDRYRSGPAVDDQYAGPVESCQSLVEEGDVQVTVSPSGQAGDGGASGGGSAGTAGSSSASSSAPSTGDASGTAAAQPAAPAGDPAERAPASERDVGADGRSSSAERMVAVALERADGGGGIAGPGAAASASPWFIALGGVLLAAVVAGAALQVYRRRP